MTATGLMVKTLNIPQYVTGVTMLQDIAKEIIRTLHLRKKADPVPFFVNKKVLITGSSSGLGRDMARAVASFGGEVILVARREDELQKVCNEIGSSGGKACYYPCDLGKMDQVDDLIAKVLKDHGHIDVLINNAGLCIRREIAETFERPDNIGRTMAINYFAPAKMILAFLPGMLERGGGKILNSLTVANLVSPTRYACYSASKGALGYFSESIGTELYRSGVTLTNAYLPLMNTPMIAGTDAYHQNEVKRIRQLKETREIVDKCIDALVHGDVQITFGFWRGSLMRVFLPHVLRSVLNGIFRSWPSRAVPVPDETTFSKKVRARWDKPIL